MIRCEPDKIRFYDPDAEHNEYLIHTVELSDDRSLSQFVTLWFKGKEQHRPEVEQWKRERGLDDHHKRELYHRDGPWIPAQFPGKESKGWSHHSHIDLTAPPRLTDMEPYEADIPPSVLETIGAYLEERDNG